MASLKIKNAKKNDEGSYQVFAENPFGDDKTDANISIKQLSDEIIDPEIVKLFESVPVNPLLEKADKFNFMAPKFIIPLADTRLKEGENCKFLCKVIGNPKPKVKKWLRSHFDN